MCFIEQEVIFYQKMVEIEYYCLFIICGIIEFSGPHRYQFLCYVYLCTFFFIVMLFKQIQISLTIKKYLGVIIGHMTSNFNVNFTNICQKLTQMGPIIIVFNIFLSP